VEVGAVAEQRLGPPVVGVLAPVRVVYVVEEPRRRGFAYGTLPGHPEIGEERFLVEHRNDGSVVASVVAFSRPGRLLTRLGGPLSWAVQSAVVGRYLRALQAGR
jgi:uncharacterized protein (UPF0548 family)